MLRERIASRGKFNDGQTTERNHHRLFRINLNAERRNHSPRKNYWMVQGFQEIPCRWSKIDERHSRTSIIRGRDEMNFRVTNIHHVNPMGQLRAFATVVIDDQFLIHGVKVFIGEKGLFVVMPREDNTMRANYESLHFLSARVQREFNETILKAYEQNPKGLYHVAEPEKKRKKIPYFPAEELPLGKPYADENGKWNKQVLNKWGT